MLVRNGTQEGFYDVLIDVKVEKTITNLRQESVFVLDDDVTIDAEDIASYVFDEHLETLRFGGNIVGLGRMHLYFGVPYASVYFDEAVASIEYLHFNLDFSVSGSTGFHNRLDLYFAGDCPEMGSGTLYNDNFAGMMIHYHEGASGFSTFMQTASTTCIEDEAFIPDVTIHEYVLATNRKGREIAKSIYERSVEAGNDEFLLFPISGLEFYFDLKEFTLELTKDCASKYEKSPRHSRMDLRKHRIRPRIRDGLGRGGFQRPQGRLRRLFVPLSRYARRGGRSLVLYRRRAHL